MTPVEPSDPLSPGAQPLLRVAWLLAFVGGYADAGSYLLTGTFTGHITGNAVLMTIRLAASAWRGAALDALAVAAVFAGTALAEWLELGAAAPGSASRMRGPLALEGALVVAATLCRRWLGGPGGDACILGMCVALGLQNGALRRCGGVTVHTTFITGTSTKIVGLLVHPPADARDARPQRHTVLALGGVWAGFVAGALGGALVTGRFPAWGLAGVLAPLTFAWLATPQDRDL